ncbi:DISARM system helicase DrmA [Streptomyces xiaopingdaonensis]|uniref:DISARM system helicase DrmA n=1 Tax=Streptomyces xiaopingdaonensis TaxID=1565415 RepID=UPI00036327C4|nr:DISARM system helicase DrmA [Streptomyces xiaopingdaonensis]
MPPRSRATGRGSARDASAALPPHPLEEVPQEFEAATSPQVRRELEEIISGDLLGPWGGQDEDLGDDSPRDRYLVGMLGPKPVTPERSEASAREAAGEGEVVEPGEEGDAQDPELPQRTTPQGVGRIWASSMGLSFVVPADVGVLSVTVAWGRYLRGDVEGEDGVLRKAWQREQFERTVDIPVNQDCKRYLEGEQGTYHVRLDVTTRDRTAPSDTGKRLRVVEVTLVNELEDLRELPDQNWLFQTQLSVGAFGTQAAVFAPIDDPLEVDHSQGGEDDAEESRLQLLYRHELRHAMGRNVAVLAQVRKNERSAHRLTTSWLPTYEVATTTAPEHEPLLQGLELGMEELAALSVSGRERELADSLQPLAAGYETWLGERAREAAQLPEHLRTSAEFALEQAGEIGGRIALGIETLRADPVALEAFRFANRAMALQRRNTEIAALRAASRESGEALSYEEALSKVVEKARELGKEGGSWRPFQLAFVLLNIASLTRPGHPHRGTSRTGLVDLLFFPTGGGKTEAYLGLAAYTFALRRLQGVVGEGSDARDGADGVGVLMRYTLRLLTAQQFQRAASLVAAAETLRREAYGDGDAAKGDDPRWGATPFRIGLWVGSKVSPNNYQEAAEQIAAAKGRADGRHANVVQVRSCPWCGEALRSDRDVTHDRVTRRILTYCPRGEGGGACPFSRRASPGEGIPVLTVDEEIYRLLPSMLIATVDKLAQLPWVGYAGMLFGRVTQWCPRHGYRHADLDRSVECGSQHHAKAPRPREASKPVRAQLRPPDLIIQDELHLISGALGTTVGLFESAVEQLCTWQVRGPGGAHLPVGPKIVASTATTKRAAEQVRGIFAREVAIFPPQVVDHTDTFFSRQVPLEQKPGRRYMGVCAHGQRLKAAEIRIGEILLRAGQHLFDKYGAPADPYMTLVGYFNATRELAGMRRYLDDDIAVRLRRNPARARQGVADRILHPSDPLTIEELTSRISSGQIASALDRLQRRFDPERDTNRRREALFVERKSAYEAKPRRAPRVSQVERAVDVVLATSMLQVGVDVARFGLMLVVGQPKNTAEYIQATSRVGRDTERPGLVVTLYNWSRPRDLAHFEDFRHYHATFYRQVEALSVTPFTRRSLDRGAAATYIAALRHATVATSLNSQAQYLDLEGETAQRVERELLDRAEVVDDSPDNRAREYFAEKIAALKDTWRDKRDGSSGLGFRQVRRKDEDLRGLLNPADGSAWDELTVPRSMRETENEINLLVPGGVPAEFTRGQDWEFPARDTGGEGTDDGASSREEQQ